MTPTVNQYGLFMTPTVNQYGLFVVIITNIDVSSTFTHLRCHCIILEKRDVAFYPPDSCTQVDIESITNNTIKTNNTTTAIAGSVTTNTTYTTNTTSNATTAIAGTASTTTANITNNTTTVIAGTAILASFTGGDSCLLGYVC